MVDEWRQLLQVQIPMGFFVHTHDCLSFFCLEEKCWFLIWIKIIWILMCFEWFKKKLKQNLMFCMKVYTIILLILLVWLDVDAIIYSCCVCRILICELLGVWGICSWFFKVFSPLICTCEFDIKSTIHELACHKQPLLEIPKLLNAF